LSLCVSAFLNQARIAFFIDSLLTRFVLIGVNPRRNMMLIFYITVRQPSFHVLAKY